MSQEPREKVDYEVARTPYGYFNDLVIRIPGHPLARVYKEFKVPKISS
jgi:hypothetical protein